MKSKNALYIYTENTKRYLENLPKIGRKSGNKPVNKSKTNSNQN